MRNIRAIIASVCFIVVGVGVATMWPAKDKMNVFGGSLFIIGLIMLAMSLFSILQKSDRDNNGHNKK